LFPSPVLFDRTLGSPARASTSLPFTFFAIPNPDQAKLKIYQNTNITIQNNFRRLKLMSFSGRMIHILNYNIARPENGTSSSRIQSVSLNFDMFVQSYKFTSFIILNLKVKEGASAD
jgi:hypothetical protein